MVIREPRGYWKSSILMERGGRLRNPFKMFGTSIQYLAEASSKFNFFIAIPAFNPFLAKLVHFGEFITKQIIYGKIQRISIFCFSFRKFWAASLPPPIGGGSFRMCKNNPNVPFQIKMILFISAFQFQSYEFFKIGRSSLCII
jgi:hypothetical protein